MAVLSHDPDTSRVYYCPGGDRSIAATRWAVLSRCRTHPSLAPNGSSTYSLPKYSTYLAQLARVPGARQWPELKVDQTAAQDRELVTMTVDRGLLSRTTWWSFSGVRVRAIRSASVRLGHANVTTGVYEAGQGITAGQARGLGVQKVGPSFFTVTSRPDYVAEQHAAGLRVAVYDVETGWRVAEAGALHVDYVIRDRPNA